MFRKLTKRTKRIILSSALAFLFLQTVTYLCWGKSSMPKTVARFLPQHTHFVQGTTFEFACVSAETWESLSEGQRRVLDETLRRHFNTIYHGEDEIPEWSKRYDARNELAALKSGCILKWEIVARAPFCFRGRYSDWEGNLAASGRDAMYVWLFCGWVRIWTSGMVIS